MSSPDTEGSHKGCFLSLAILLQGNCLLATLQKLAPRWLLWAETSYSLTTPYQGLIFAIPGPCLPGPYLLCLLMVPPGACLKLTYAVPLQTSQKRGAGVCVLLGASVSWEV